MTKRYRPPGSGTFKFPFRRGPKSMATGRLNAPGQGRPSKSMPSIKQFSPTTQRRKPKGK